MKKNISINISGIIFHIEEDGYDMLRKYLDSVTRYFSSFEDSTEILADIEGRIAEIFLSKLTDAKQVITSDDVQLLMGIMGNVNDFKAAEQNDFATDSASAEPTAAKSNSKQSQPNTGYTTKAEPKRLHRDQQRKILGGVCAGIANYFNVDAVWIRLLFALLLFAYGAAVIAYIILWIAVPGSFNLEEPIDTKKMYRDPEKKVLGGVAAGIAAYFGTDVVLVRILLIISLFFFGTGLLLYIVLWVVLPEAKSITDRMQMQGEPVTLSNIESNIKKNINEDQTKEESVLTKILLLPFRALAAIFTALGKILVPIAEVVRVAAGIMLAFISFVLLFSILTASGVFVGIFSSFPTWLNIGIHSDLSFPIQAFVNSVPTITIVAACLGLIVPTIFFLLLGISIVAKKYVFNSIVGWTLFGLWFASAVVLGVTIPRIVYGFKAYGEHKIETVYTPSGNTAIFNLRQTGLDDYHATSLTLKGHQEKTFKLVQKFKAQGSNSLQAAENAKMVGYNLAIKDSVFLFDSNIFFKNGAVFRAQELEMTLYIPYNYPFVMDEAMSKFITQYVDWRSLDGKTWKMTEGGLVCITCEEDNTANLNNNWNFDEIDISGFVDVNITQSDNFSVELLGDSDEKANYSIEQSGSTLYVRYKKFDNNETFEWKKDMVLFDEVEINISMPSIEKLQAKGAGKINLQDFTSDDLEVDLAGAFKSRVSITAHSLTVDIKGASELELNGEGNNLEATIIGASRLRAYGFETQDAIVETLGVSSARVNVTGILETTEGVGSSISYRGNPIEVKKN